MTTKLTLSKGNMKIKNTLIFNLPTVKTCPMATEACKAFCYAAKAERMYPNVLPSRTNNFEASRSESFVQDMIEAINKLNKNNKYQYFRIHESGDFYNQKYLDKWFDIAKHNSDIHFLAYTKSHHLDFSNKPDNMTVRYSIDETTKQARIDMPLAIVKTPNQENRNKKTFDCIPGMKCHECRVCWTSSIDVAFKLH